MHTTRELIEVFFLNSYPALLSGKVIPRLKFIFSDDIYQILEDVKNNPFVKENHWTPNIEDEDIEYVRENNKQDEFDNYVIYVPDVKLFFDRLVKLINTFEK